MSRQTAQAMQNWYYGKNKDLQMNLIGVTHVGEIAVIEPMVKRLDASAAPAFRLAVLDLIAAGDSRLVFDLAGVDFIDSSGLGSMVSILKALSGRGGIAICNASAAVLSLFRLTRMDKVFSIVPGRDEAVAKVTA